MTLSPHRLHIRDLPPLQTSVRIADSSGTDVEQGQSLQRLYMVVGVVSFILLRNAAGLEPELSDQAMMLLLGYFSAFLFYALGIYALVRLRPGRFPLRRLIVMQIDYISIGFSMVVGGQMALPIYAVLVWVTVGNGMRFGPVYLVIATLMAMVTLLVVAVLTPYWQANPDMTLALCITTLVVPAYAYGLLRRTVQARRAADEANLAKSRFLAQASHDLRQPVHAAGLFLAGLRRTRLSREQRDMVDRMERSLDSVARLFRLLLDLSSLDSGQTEPKPEPVALRGLVQEIVQQHASLAERFGVSVRIAGPMIHVHTDRAMLLTLVQNLLANAIKYGRGRPVLIGWRRRGTLVRIEVHDRGAGIDPAELPGLFDEYVRLHRPGDRDVEGVGLGLAIVRRLSETLGLGIEIATLQNRGTSVLLTGLAAVAAPAVTEAGPLMTMPLAGTHVVLVEDDENVLIATSRQLEAWGCHVQGFAGRPSGVEAADIIIADFDLGGGLTAVEVIAQLRAQLGGELAAIIITAHDESRVRALLAGAPALILPKPVRPAELRSGLMSLRRRAAA